MTHIFTHDLDHPGTESGVGIYAGGCPHMVIDQTGKSEINGHVSQPRYNARLRPDDELSTDEETDRSSQISSDESGSQTSDYASLTPPPNMSGSFEYDDRASYQYPASQNEHQRTATPVAIQSNDVACSRPLSAFKVPRSKTNRPLVKPSSEPQTTPTPAPSQNVAFRPKPVDVRQNVVTLPSGLRLDTSTGAEDVQRSRMRPQERVNEDEKVSTHPRRRFDRCSGAPPKLCRDTDHTDNIVKMIVLFCTNLINSIWTPVASETTTTTQQQSSGSNVLPLQVFITETLRRSKTSYSTLQIALYYLILLKQMLPPPGLAHHVPQGSRATHCGRRMFLTALILASKYLQDRNYSARAWSKISGLPLKEINDNERRYLSMVHWDLHVPKNTFENWSKIVLNVCRLSSDSAGCARELDSLPPPPPPGTGPSGLNSMTNNVCQAKTVALRNWWLQSLQVLCTDIVKCAQKTERYVCGISPFRKDSYTIPRSLGENVWQPDTTAVEAGEHRSPKSLTQLPSIETMDRSFFAQDQSNSPAMMPTSAAPRMLANLPTPQQTPHAPDMASMWTPKTVDRGLRCRASASALAALDQRRCPMATLNTCPPPLPLPKPAASRPWTAYQYAVEHNNVPDRSLTSSPESVISEAPSVFSHGIPSRSRSSSMSSTVSWATSDSLHNLGLEKLGNMAVSQPSFRESQPLGFQETFRGDGKWSDLATRSTSPDETNCPLTALQSSSNTPEAQKPAVLSEPPQAKDRSLGMFRLLTPNFSTCSSFGSITPRPLQQHSCAVDATSSRPRLRRPATQVFDRNTSTDLNTHTLKRSRSESFENHATEQRASQALCNTENQSSTQNIQTHPHRVLPLPESIYDDFPNSGKLEKLVVQSSRNDVMSRMPISSGDQFNKRFALQTSKHAACSSGLDFKTGKRRFEHSKLSRAMDGQHEGGRSLHRSVPSLAALAQTHPDQMSPICFVGA